MSTSKKRPPDMEPIIYDQIEQNSEEWHRVRLGLPTASTFSQLLAKGEGKSRRALMRRLAGEIITGEPGETFRSSSMDRGHEMESEARAFYSLMADNEPRLVGFVRNEIAGCSPDALIGEDGVLEIKTAKPEVLIEIMERDTFPPEHVAQTTLGAAELVQQAHEHATDTAKDLHQHATDTAHQAHQHDVETQQADDHHDDEMAQRKREKPQGFGGGPGKRTI